MSVECTVPNHILNDEHPSCLTRTDVCDPNGCGVCGFNKANVEYCACGCGHLVPKQPYEHDGKHYASAYCIIKVCDICYMCGMKHSECTCDLSILDGGMIDE